MFKVLFSLFVILVLAACETESVAPTHADDQQRIETRTPGPKVDVCHNGMIINISINTVPAHQANHGDAVDLDGDGYFDKESACGEGVDCDDNDPDIGAEVVSLYIQS